jgi:hypothetical protein
MPSILGGISGSIAAFFFQSSSFNRSELEMIYPAIYAGRSFKMQGAIQLGFLIITVVIAIFSGGLVGLLVSYISTSKKFYVDSESWEVPDSEIPFFFDTKKDQEVINKPVNFSEFEKRLNNLESQFKSRKE